MSNNNHDSKLKKIKKGKFTAITYLNAVRVRYHKCEVTIIQQGKEEKESFVVIMRKRTKNAVCTASNVHIETNSIRRLTIGVSKDGIKALGYALHLFEQRNQDKSTQNIVMFEYKGDMEEDNKIEKVEVTPSIIEENAKSNNPNNDIIG